MWIYKDNGEDSKLISTDHVQTFYIYENSIYAVMDTLDSSDEKIATLSSDEEVAEFIRWIAENIGVHRNSREIANRTTKYKVRLIGKRII